MLLAAGRRDSAIFARVWRRGIVPGPQQYEMAARVDDEGIQYQADFWPRDHGKSEIFCISYPLRRICEDPNVRILIVQKTATEAEKTLGVIKTELESNEDLKNYYRQHWRDMVGAEDICNAGGQVQTGRKKEGAWQQRRIYVKRSRRGKDPTIESVGVGGAITGGHFDVIILDDVEDDENTRTEERVDGLVNWFTGTIMQLREPHTKIIVVGTLKTLKPDIYKLVRENPAWDCQVVSAITSHTLSEIEYEPVYHEETGRLVDVTIRTEGVTTLWPAKWDLRTLLMEMLASPRRSIWIREKLNDLHALAGKMFKRQWFHYEEPERLPRLVKTVQAWDTSYGEGKSNFSVCVTAALSADNKVYVLRVRRERLEFPELVRAMRSEYERMRPSRVVVEDKVSGRSAIQTLERETTIPLVRVSPGTQDKAARAEAVTPYYEAGRVVHVTGGDWLDTFEDELVMFPDGEFDDQVDALVYAVMDLVGNERGLEMGSSPLEGYRG